MAVCARGTAMRISRVSAALRGLWQVWQLWQMVWGQSIAADPPRTLFSLIFFLEEENGTAITAISPESFAGSSAYLWQVAPLQSASSRNTCHDWVSFFPPPPSATGPHASRALAHPLTSRPGRPLGGATACAAATNRQHQRRRRRGLWAHQHRPQGRTRSRPR